MRAFGLLLAASLSLSAAVSPADFDLWESLAQDDECAGEDGGSCAIHKLQFRSAKHSVQTEEGKASAPEARHNVTADQPSQLCSIIGCHDGVPELPCQCGPACVDRGDCCRDYFGYCMLPSPEVAAPVDFNAAFMCESSFSTASVLGPEGKGLVVDDLSLRRCVNRLPAFFPNTQERVKSLRITRAWDRNWPEKQREMAWRMLAKFVKVNGVKVLVGTPVTCNTTLDAQSWAWTKSLLQMLSPQNVMGLSIGEEVDYTSTLSTWWNEPNTPFKPCVKDLWEGGRFFQQVRNYSQDLDMMGFSMVPLTTVLSQRALEKNNTLLRRFLDDAVTAWGPRFVFSFNFQPEPRWNEAALPCANTMLQALNLESKGLTQQWLTATSLAVKAISPSARIWLAGLGWGAEDGRAAKRCGVGFPASTAALLKRFYTGFLAWNVSNVDHVFYAALRDEGRPPLGLLEDCPSTSCKIQEDLD